MVESHKNVNLKDRNAELITVENMVESMAQRYTMPEELENHNEVVGGDLKAPVVENEEDDLTFF